MRQKRAKAYKRLMSLYSQVFGFRSPFQVLVESDFLLDACKKDIDIWKQLATCVQAECKPMITQCSIETLYKLGPEFQNVVDVAKSFERRRCNHREAKPEAECVADVVGPTNKHRYSLALQDTRQRNQLRRIPGVPIIHFNERGVLVLELPSPATLAHKEKEEQARMTAQIVTHPSLPNVITDPNAAASTATKRKKVKGPNPLSVRKKKGVDSKPGPSQQSQRPEPAKATDTAVASVEALSDANEQPPSRSKATDTDAHQTQRNLKRSRESEEDERSAAAQAGNVAVKKRKRKRPKKATGAGVGSAHSDSE